MASEKPNQRESLDDELEQMAKNIAETLAGNGGNIDNSDDDDVVAELNKAIAEGDIGSKPDEMRRVRDLLVKYAAQIEVGWGVVESAFKSLFRIQPRDKLLPGQAAHQLDTYEDRYFPAWRADVDTLMAELSVMIDRIDLAIENVELKRQVEELSKPATRPQRQPKAPPKAQPPKVSKAVEPQTPPQAERQRRPAPKKPRTTRGR